jgi:hypothetical protein
MAGTAGIHPEIYRGLKYYWYYKRPKHDPAIDVVAGHNYATTGVNGDGEVKSPENDSLLFKMQEFVAESRELCPQCETWLGEFGYDRNRVSPLGVPIIPGKDSSEIQAEWIIRSWLHLSFSGLDRATIFQIRNDPLAKDYDSVGTTKFNTSGLADYHQYTQEGGTVYTNYYAFAAWYFQHALYAKLGNYKADSVIYYNMDSIWVYRYRSINDPDSICYVYWSGTQTNRGTAEYNIKTGHANMQVSITSFADKLPDGATITPTTNANGELNIVINESPKMLFTTEGADGGQLVENTDEPPPTTPTAKALLYLLDNGKIIILNSDK